MSSNAEPGLLDRLKSWARAIKRDILALWIAGRDPRTPAAAKLLAVLVAAYALSPIDLIPDFIPVLGYLDELILLPLGIAIVVALIPPELMEEYRDKADRLQRRPTSKIAAAAIVLLWAALAVLMAWLMLWLVNSA